MLDWSKIVGKVAIHCTTQIAFDSLMQECERKRITWNAFERPTYHSYFWDSYKEETCVAISDSGRLVFSPSSYYKAQGYKIIEFSDLYKPDLPRICYILGGEENPLKVGEHFSLNYDCVEGEFIYYINEDGDVCVDGLSTHLGDGTLCDIINHPEKIIRQPQFSEDEKALMREFIKAGRPIFSPDGEEKVCAWDMDGARGNGLPKGILSQIKERFDAAAYLESEAQKK